ncbi:MAG TPA: ABC transporter permease [Pyrinomonadaceae bacterium]
MRPLRSDLYENLRMALANLREHKLRSILTLVGVVVGVWTVIAIASIISGIDVAVQKEVESFGTRTIFLYKFDPGLRTSEPTREERMRKNLTEADAAAIAELPAVELAVPNLMVPNYNFGQKILVSAGGKTSANVKLEGALPAYEETAIWTIAEGRFFTSYENRTNQQVCVLASNIVERFFPDQYPVGQSLKIGGREFRVIGTLEKREGFLFSGDDGDDMNNSIFIPLEVAHKLRPSAEDTYIVIIARPGRLEEAKDQITSLLRVRRQVPFDQPDNFGMATADSVTQQFRSIIFAVALAMIAISSVGLIVGGIGVMNIMLVSVTERTREIGIRKAMGARRRDILIQFLFEAMTLTGIGGLMGLSLGWATTLLIRLSVPSYVPLWAPVAGSVASVGIGLIFGLWPAWKAARLNPVEALRYE